MKLLVLNHDEVVRLLPMSECIDVMQEALSGLARGEAELPLRPIFRPENVRGVMAMMPSFRRGDSPLFGLKAICVFPDNAAIGIDAHQGGVLVFSGQTGELMALVNASAITAIRTAAVSGVATRTLARQEANELAIIGAGVQGRTHLEAMAHVRPLRRARIVAQRFENAQAFADEMQAKFDFTIEPVRVAEEAVREANLIVTATTSHDPVIKREWIRPGSHINAVGTYSPKAREIDTATIVAASLFVDRRESALNEAGDYMIPAAEGLIGPDHIRAELGEILIGKHAGRSAHNEITVFKSLGLAIEDLAAAEYVYQKGKEKSVGSLISF